MDKNSSGEVDIAEAAAEIGADLFSSDVSSASEEDGELSEVLPEEEEGEEDSSSAGSEEPPLPQSEEAPLENSPEVQELGAPNSWTREAIEDWAKIPPRVQQEIHKREQDFHQGIQGYRALAERGHAYEQVVEPYRATLAATGVDPVQLFNSFASNHYMLSFGSPEQKLQIAKNLLHSYNIDPVSLAQMFSGEGAAPVRQEDPEVAFLRNKVLELERGVNSQQETQNQQAVQAAYNEIDNFKLSHPFFDEVAEDMEQLLRTKAATGLADAYEIAVYRNPTVRAKELARLSPPASPSPAPVSDKKAKALAANISPKPQSRNGTVAGGTMEETLEETYDRIMSEE